MSFPPFNNESWEEAPQQPLTWTGAGWYHNGDNGGCTVCRRNVAVNDTSTWSNGYAPTSVSFTVTVDLPISAYAFVSFSIVTTLEEFAFDNDTSLFKSAGTYTLTIPLIAGHEVSPGVFTTISNYGLGVLGEIIAVGFYMGELEYSEDPGWTPDRPFTITDISFLPDNSITPREWTSYVNTIETIA